jgi:hypothetical protein
VIQLFPILATGQFSVAMQIPGVWGNQISPLQTTKSSLNLPAKGRYVQNFYIYLHQKQSLFSKNKQNIIVPIYKTPKLNYFFIHRTRTFGP